jgi:lysophospholipase L1-like esterase
MPSAAPALTNWTRRCLPLGLVGQWLQPIADALAAVLAALAADGIRVAAVLPTPPAHRSSEKLLELLVSYNREPSVAPAPVCAKLHWLMRQKLAAVAAAAGVRFVDSWALFSDDGLFLAEDYEFDGMHVSRAAALKFLPTLCDAVRPRAT